MSTTEQTALEILSPDRGIAPSSTANSGQITDTLKRAMERGHLVSPSTTCPNLPIGCEVAFSAVLINSAGADVYPVGGKLGLAKPALDKIAKAVGVSWDPIQSRRLDDGSDPYYASYRAVGFYRHFDGTMMQIMGEKQMDLHDESEWAKKMTAGELSMQRKFIAEHAETKARLRAIRSLGLQTSYTKDELAKPFIVAKLMLTGRVSKEDDPTGELQKILTHNISQSMMGGSRLLYGERESPSGMPPVAEDTPVPALPEATGAETSSGQPATSPEITQATGAANTPKQCNPGMCFGLDPGAAHIPACFGAEAPASVPEPWIIPAGRGPAQGLAINDERITPQVLGSMRDFYVITIKDKTTEPLTKQGLVEEQKFLEAEIQRRGLFEYAREGR